MWSPYVRVLTESTFSCISLHALVTHFFRLFARDYLEGIVLWCNLGDEVATNDWNVRKDVLLDARKTIEEEDGERACCHAEASDHRSSRVLLVRCSDSAAHDHGWRADRREARQCEYIHSSKEADVVLSKLESSRLYS